MFKRKYKVKIFYTSGINIGKFLMWFNSSVFRVFFSDEKSKNLNCSVVQATVMEIYENCNYKKAVCWQYRNYEKIFCDGPVL